ncbi:MAG: tetratricopeptide repeat protein [Armatimonadota bacterium]|nr:MAG: tetratricopeptide repeat protein [Armatimonadota bacterium]
MKRSRILWVVPFPLVILVLLSGCSTVRDVVRAARVAAQIAQSQSASFSLNELEADCDKPKGAAEILIGHLVVQDAKDEDLALFNAAYCQDLGLRVTRLPQVRGQVPGWVLSGVMEQCGISTLALGPEQAMKVAHLGGRRHALTGTIERRSDEFHARIEIYDAKSGKLAGEAIELTGTAQEFLRREGWLAEQIAERIGVKLTKANREWLNRPQFSDYQDFAEIARLMRHEGEGHTVKLGARRDRQPYSLLVEQQWFQCDPFKDRSAYIAALRESHKRFPQEPNFQRWIMEHHMRQADRAEAKAALDELLKLHPGSWEGLNVRARYYHNMERDYESALRATESMAVLYPDCWISWFRCAHEALTLAYDARAGHYFSEMNSQQQRVFRRGMSEALAAGERALELNDSDEELLTTMIHIYYENSMPREAEDAFERAIALDPGNVKAYSALAAMYKPGYQNDEQRRTALLKQALAAPAKTVENLRVQADIALYLEQIDRGMELFEKALQAAGSASVPGLHLDYAWALADKRKRYDEAEKHARISLQQCVSADAYMSLAQFLAKQERFDEAMAAAKAAKKLEPDNPDCDAALAVVLEEMGEVDDALKHMAKAHEGEPRHVTYLGAMLDGYLTQGDTDKAWEVMQEIKRHPEWEEAEIELLDVGDIHALKGKFTDAIRYYDLNLGKKPGNVKSFTRGALCYMMMRDFRSAADRWRKVFDKEPNHAESHMGLGVCLSMLGEKQKALEEARKAVTADGKVADRKYLAKERYWPKPLAQAAADLAADAKRR